ncbi:hypothetical protein [Prevotella corporis]|uniref:hypothetical protein n=1 Tax=Prevotella corporis TaxID=28128 RepID=UPI001EE29B7D|nr:hypothetical protein [Prevotella corporis]
MAPLFASWQVGLVIVGLMDIASGAVTSTLPVIKQPRLSTTLTKKLPASSMARLASVAPSLFHS